jgi:phosphomevalonate kinase
MSATVNDQPADSLAAAADSGLRIPGKVMLSGEYAVLAGATAVLLPVPRYLKLARAAAEPEGGYPPALAAARDIAVHELAEHEQCHGLPHAAVDASAFYHINNLGERVKLGLGLSAAEAVGMLALRFHCAGRDWTAARQQIYAAAQAAHRTAQNGAGSGADIAACAWGRPLLFARPSPAQASILPLVDGARPTLPLHLYFSGSSADTRVLVAGFEQWRGDDPSSHEKLSQLTAAAAELAPLWFDAEPAALRTALTRWDRELTLLLAGAQVSYRLPVHRRIEEWAQRYGGCAKPTGAGGGDMILLVGDMPVQRLQGLLIPLAAGDTPA